MKESFLKIPNGLYNHIKIILWNMKNVLTKHNILMLIFIILIGCHNKQNTTKVNESSKFVEKRTQSYDTIEYDTLIINNKLLGKNDTIYLFSIAKENAEYFNNVNFELSINSKKRYKIYYPYLEWGCPNAKLNKIPKNIKNRYNSDNFAILLIYRDYFLYYIIEFNSLTQSYYIKDFVEIMNMDDTIIDEAKHSLDTIEKIITTKVNLPFDSIKASVIQQHTPFDLFGENVEFKYILRKDGK